MNSQEIEAAVGMSRIELIAALLEVDERTLMERASIAALQGLLANNSALLDPRESERNARLAKRNAEALLEELAGEVELARKNKEDLPNTFFKSDAGLMGALVLGAETSELVIASAVAHLQTTGGDIKYTLFPTTSILMSSEGSEPGVRGNETTFDDLCAAQDVPGQLTAWDIAAQLISSGRAAVGGGAAPLEKFALQYPSANMVMSKLAVPLLTESMNGDGWSIAATELNIER